LSPLAAISKSEPGKKRNFSPEVAHARVKNEADTERGQYQKENSTDDITMAPRNSDTTTVMGPDSRSSSFKNVTIRPPIRFKCGNCEDEKLPLKPPPVCNETEEVLLAPSEHASQSETPADLNAEADVKIPEQQTSIITLAADAEFKSFARRANKVSGGQKEHDEVSLKITEAELASDVKDDNAVLSGAHLITVDENAAEDPNQYKEFDPNAFKEAIRTRIQVDFPNSKAEKQEFEKRGGLNKLNKQVIPDVKNEQEEYVAVVSEIEDPSILNPVNKDEIFFQEPLRSDPEDAGKRPVLGNIGQAVPKPLPPDEFKMDEEHDAASLDRLMQENNITDRQLAESEEPGFLATLAQKQESQKELCSIPLQLKEKADSSAERSIHIAKNTVDGSLNTFSNSRHEQFDSVQDEKEGLTKEDELILRDYYLSINGIFTGTQQCVACILNNLETDVMSLFENAVNESYSRFKSYVSSRLDDYYGSSFLIFTVGNDLEDEDDWRKLANAAIDEEIRSLREKSAALDPHEAAQKDMDRRILELQEKRIKLNIEQIFEQGKTSFIYSLDEALDSIAQKVSEGLKLARLAIQTGKKDIDDANEKLPANLQIKADERTKEIQSRFTDLEQTITDKEADLIEDLSKQYNDSVSKLKETFEEIRAEAALKWWEKAWRAIKEIALIIYDLGKLLLDILAKAAGVIGDILSSPVQFFKNLVQAISDGFNNFKANILDHLEKLIFDLIIGSVPPGIELPAVWDAKGIFGFVLSVLGLTKETIRAQAVEKLGAPLVNTLEHTFDLFILFKDEGFAGLWNHVKERIGDLKDQIIEEVKRFFKESIFEAAIEFFLSVLTPASGFIKVCKTIINIVTFFIRNLKNLLKLLDSILDSLIYIAAGNLTAAALKVEDALHKAMVFGVKFLAALVGINFDKIQAKVAKIINAVKSPVKRAINWFFDKALEFARRSGLLDVAVKGKEKAKGLVSKVAGWLGLKKDFRGADGENHHLSIEQSGGQYALFVASDPIRFRTFLTNKEKELDKNGVAANDPLRLTITEARAKNDDFDRALKILKAEDDVSRSDRQSRTTGHNQDAFNRANQLMDELLPLVARLVTRANEYPPVRLPLFANNVLAGNFRAEYIKEGRFKRFAASNSGSHRGNLEGWQEIQNAGLSANGDWVKMHLYTHRLGGLATDSNLAPASRMLNDKMEQFEDTADLAVKGKETIWYEISNISYQTVVTPGGPKRYLSSIAANWGKYTFKNGQFMPVPDSRNNRPVQESVAAPLFTGVAAMNINDMGQFRLQSVVGLDEWTARKVAQALRLGLVGSLPELEGSLAALSPRFILPDTARAKLAEAHKQKLIRYI